MLKTRFMRIFFISVLRHRPEFFEQPFHKQREGCDYEREHDTHCRRVGIIHQRRIASDDHDIQVIPDSIYIVRREVAVDRIYGAHVREQAAHGEHEHRRYGREDHGDSDADKFAEGRDAVQLRALGDLRGDARHRARIHDQPRRKARPDRIKDHRTEGIFTVAEEVRAILDPHQFEHGGQRFVEEQFEDEAQHDARNNARQKQHEPEHFRKKVFFIDVVGENQAQREGDQLIRREHDQ